MQKAKKWLILLLISLSLASAGAILFPDVSDMPVFPVLALIFGCFGGGYACSQLDQLTGLMAFRVHIELSRHPKLSIKRIPERK